jgi:hypothetical protein
LLPVERQNKAVGNAAITSSLLERRVELAKKFDRGEQNQIRWPPYQKPRETMGTLVVLGWAKDEVVLPRVVRRSHEGSGNQNGRSSVFEQARADAGGLVHRYRNSSLYSGGQPDDVPVRQSNTAVAHSVSDRIGLVGTVNTNPTFI